MSDKSRKMDVPIQVGQITIKSVFFRHMMASGPGGESIDASIGGFVLGWSSNMGFGEITITNEGGKWIVQDEHMGKSFVKYVLWQLVDSAKVE